MAKVLLTVYGSYGDLHPFIAIGKVLLKIGHKPTIATHPHYKEIVEGAGIDFLAMRPSEEDFGPEEVWTPHAHNLKTGTLYFFKNMLLPYFKQSFEILNKEVKNFDLVVSHQFTWAAPIAAEHNDVKWISCALQPMAFLSCYDPPSFAHFPYLPHLRFLGSGFIRRFLKKAFAPFLEVYKPIHSLRKELGLKDISYKDDIRFFSEHGTLVLFPTEYASSKPDWPKNFMQMGFPLYENQKEESVSLNLRNFLKAGLPPVVFTLGSTIVKRNTIFYDVTYRVVKKLNLRAVFLVGKKRDRMPQEAYMDKSVFISEYEPFSKLFPSCEAIVHQCGIGTSAQALHAGKPQVLVPFSHDQPDNARRIAQMGVGEVLAIGKLTEKSLEQKLLQILTKEKYKKNAQELKNKLQLVDFEKNLVEVMKSYL